MQTSVVLKRSFYSISHRDRLKFTVIAAIQFISSVMDLIAVSLLGALSIILASEPSEDRNVPALASFLNYLFGFSSNRDELVFALGLVAILLFLSKSIFILFISRRIWQFLADKAARISEMTYEKLTNKSIAFIEKTPSQEIINSLNFGVSSAVIVILGSLSVILAEIGLLLLLLLVLVVVNPLLTLICSLYFVMVAICIHKVVSRLSLQASREKWHSDVQTGSILQDSIFGFREIRVLNSWHLFMERFRNARTIGSQSVASFQWIGLIPKYSMEFALISGLALFIMFYYLNGNSNSAISTTAIFLAASSRIIPSILRIQGSLGAFQSARGPAEGFFQLQDDMNSSPENPQQRPSCLISNTGLSKGNSFSPAICLTSVSYQYPNQGMFALSDINVNISPGSSWAIVGRSGAGKSTLADLILGFLSPQTGTVTLGGCNPKLALQKWPGKIGYVPQRVSLFNCSLRENVAISCPKEEIEDAAVWEVLEKAQLADFFLEKGLGLDVDLGENGIQLSGGQRQRLALARALYNKPQLLILDEATSSLDGKTQSDILNMIRKMQGNVTTIAITHRLEAIKSADTILYLNDGKVKAIGSLDEILKHFPNFESQIGMLENT